MARLAIAHEWLLNHRGAERVLREFCVNLDDVTIYTLLLRRGLIDPDISRVPIQVSPLTLLPGVQRYYRLLLPLYEFGFRSLRVKNAEAVLSISHLVAKTIPRDNRIPHICYCLTPARFVWKPVLYGPALNGSISGHVLRALSPRLKARDLAANANVDHFVAISEVVRSRIQNAYGRDSKVIHPCTDLTFFTPSDAPRDDFLLIVSALVPQKRVDLAVRAFNKTGEKLLIVGDGPLRRRLEKMSRPNIQFLGLLGDSEIRELYRRARGLIFPGADEFGLVPVEAQACGCPVVAFREGGALETILEGRSGYFFDHPTPESLAEAAEELRRNGIDDEACTRNASRFSRQRFLDEWIQYFSRLGLKFPLRRAPS